MTLQDYAAIAQILTGLAGLAFTGLGAFATWYAYRWHKQNAMIESQRRLSEDLRHYNELVLREPEIQRIEGQKHP